MSEPFYVRQSGELKPEEIKAWFEMCRQEAEAEGATFGRFSVDDHTNPKAAIVEAWKKMPKDQGHIRWALTLTPPQEGANQHECPECGEGEYLTDFGD